MVHALFLKRLLREHIARPKQHKRRRALRKQRPPDERRAARITPTSASRGRERRDPTHLNACSSLDIAPPIVLSSTRRGVLSSGSVSRRWILETKRDCELAEEGEVGWETGGKRGRRHPRRLAPRLRALGARRALPNVGWRRARGRFSLPSSHCKSPDRCFCEICLQVDRQIYALGRYGHPKQVHGASHCTTSRTELSRSNVENDSLELVQRDGSVPFVTKRLRPRDYYATTKR